MAENALQASNMNLSDCGKQPLMRAGWFTKPAAERLAQAEIRLLLANAFIGCTRGAPWWAPWSMRRKWGSACSARAGAIAAKVLQATDGPNWRSVTAKFLRAPHRRAELRLVDESAYFFATHVVVQPMVHRAEDGTEQPNGIKRMLLERPGRWVERDRGKLTGKAGGKRPRLPKLEFPGRQCAVCEHGGPDQDESDYFQKQGLGQLEQLWSERACCAKRIVENEPDFLEQKSRLQEIMETFGNVWALSPKFMCELAAVERCAH
jgi:hypothetical protein